MILKDKVVLVTGSGNGIGAAITNAMAEAGATIVSADIDLEAAQRSADKAASYQVKSLAVQVDVRDVASINAMIAKATAEFGQLDVIVNNAGVTRRAYIMDLTEDDWDRIHTVNARGVFFCLQGAARVMIEQGGGRIINIASVAGRGYINTSNAAYAASKGAVISLTKTAAQQLGPHNINVNAICPGVTNTPMGDAIAIVKAKEQGVSVEEARRGALETIPIRRANEPEDIAALAVFLASPGARNITAQSYNVDGGLVPC